MMNINKEDLIETLKEFKMVRKKHRLKLDSVISPFLSDNLSKKQGIELCQVGKFLTLLDKPSQIISHSDSPDFIISYDGDKIGLEHERIFKKENVGQVKSISKLFDDAAEVFKEMHPNLNLLANCWLNTDNFTFKKSEARILKVEISNYIYSQFTNEQNFEKPSYIDHLLLMKHSQVSFCYNPGGYIVNSLDRQSLESAIFKKEPLVDKYKMNSGLQRQWLLIVIGSASPDSFEFGEKQFQININSNFEKVFLMEDLKAKVWQVI